MLTVSQACKVQKLQKRATVRIGWPLNVPLCPPIPSLYLLNDLYQIISLKVCAFCVRVHVRACVLEAMQPLFCLKMLLLV